MSSIQFQRDHDLQAARRGGLFLHFIFTSTRRVEGCQSTQDIVRKIKLYLGEQLFPFDKVQEAVEVLLKVAEQYKKFLQIRAFG